MGEITIRQPQVRDALDEQFTQDPTTVFYFDLVHVFGVRFDKPWPTCYRGFHFLTKRTQVCAYAEVRQRPDRNSLCLFALCPHLLAFCQFPATHIANKTRVSLEKRSVFRGWAEPLSCIPYVIAEQMP
jgi:hypothetical protein